MKKFIFSIFILFLAGCSSLGPKLPAENFIKDISENDSGIIFSTGAIDTSLSFSTSVELYHHSDDYERVYTAYIDYPFTSHFKGRHGHLHALKLNPGKYCYHIGSGNPYMKVTNSPSNCIWVEKGSIYYAGEFYLTGNLLRINDEYDRDTQMLNLGTKNVTKNFFKIK